MSILITGGAGYIGSHTCVELLKLGKEIVVLDNFYNASMECINRVKEISGKDFPFYECDLLDKEGLNKIFEEHKIDSVIHFAGYKAVPESVTQPMKYYYNNITGTIILCEVMQAHGVKTLIFSSSATVYGSKNVAPFDETMQTGNCTNPYGSTKFMIEEILTDLAKSDSEWSIALLRYFNPIGAHESGRIGNNPNGIPLNIMPLITQAAIGKLEKLTVTGNDYDTPDGTGLRDYVHINDLVTGHILALEKLKQTTGVNVYNLGTGKTTSVLELVAAFEKASNKKVPIAFVPRRAGDVAIAYANVDKAKKDLNFVPQYDIDRMCADEWRWQSMNPEGM